MCRNYPLLDIHLWLCLLSEGASFGFQEAVPAKLTTLPDMAPAR
jgi:hypothetical protein